MGDWLQAVPSDMSSTHADGVMPPHLSAAQGGCFEDLGLLLRRQSCKDWDWDQGCLPRIA